MTAPSSLTYLRERHTAAMADPTNPYLIASLDAAVRLYDASEYLRHEEEREARKGKQRRLPERYSPIRGEKPYEYGFIAPDGVGYGFWVSRDTMHEEAWKHCDDPDDFDDPEEVDQESLPEVPPVVHHKALAARHAALRTAVRAAVGDNRFAELERAADIILADAATDADASPLAR